MAQIIVIGAGVIGLQTAVTLLEAGYKVIIIAKHWPGNKAVEYTSPWAGAIWRSHATPDQVEACQWDLASYQEWLRTVDEEPEKATDMGVKKCPIHLFSMSSVNIKPWFAPQMQCYSTHVIRNSGNGMMSLQQTFNSVSINPDTYLSSLQRRAVHLGARCLTADLATASGFASAMQAMKTLVSETANGTGTTADTVAINCTGLAAKGLCGDEAVYPIRGQTLLVRITPPVAQEILLYNAGDSVTYIVPRPGTDTFIFGGTKDAGNADPVPTPDISASILERCQRLLATQGHVDLDVEVVQEQVGFRPGRKGGARVEVEEVELGNGEVVKVVHSYGHAGTGYQGSIGSAEKVLRLVGELVE